MAAKGTDAMEAAGLECVCELAAQDLAYSIRSIYLAMEYERLSMNGQLSGLGEECLNIRQT